MAETFVVALLIAATDGLWRFHHRRLYPGPCIEDDDCPIVDANVPIARQFAKLHRNGFACTADEGCQVGLCQADIEQCPAGGCFPVFFRKPLEQAHEPFRNGQIRNIFGNGKRIVSLLMKILGDIHGQRRKLHDQPVQMLGPSHAKKGFRHADGYRRAFNGREENFLSEQTACIQDRDCYVLIVEGPASKTNGTPLNEVNETGWIALMEEILSLFIGFLDEEMFAICNRFVRRAIEQTRLFEIPDFIFRDGLLGDGWSTQ